mmetsp:Transcript_4080/g.7168  ORF Transcript_4080/g.7168 Transcript_4080/m.7168 type:complete len:653 (-) Transcript_4080:90-2048(-)
MQQQGSGGGSGGKYPGTSVSMKMSRCNELMDQLRAEFEGASQRIESFYSTRDDYARKLYEQALEVTAIENAVLDLERKNQYMRDHYDQEIRKLRNKLAETDHRFQADERTVRQKDDLPSFPGVSDPALATPDAKRARTFQQNTTPTAPTAGTEAPRQSLLDRTGYSDGVLGRPMGGPSPAPLGMRSDTRSPAAAMGSHLGSGTLNGEGLYADSRPLATGHASALDAGVGNRMSGAFSGMDRGYEGAPGDMRNPPSNRVRDSIGNSDNRLGGFSSHEDPRNVSSGVLAGGVDASAGISARASMAMMMDRDSDVTANAAAAGVSQVDDYVVYQGRSSSGMLLNINIKLQNSYQHESVVCCVRYSWNGQYLATGSNRYAQVFDANTGKKIATYARDDEPGSETQDSYVRAVCFSPDGKWLITGAEDHMVKVWDVRNRTVKHRLIGHETDIYSVDASPDSQFIISGSGDKNAILWSLQSGKKLMTLGGGEYGPSDGITSVSVSPTSQLVAAGSLDKIVRVWDVESGRLVRSFEGHRDSVYAVAFSPDGRMLLSGSLDRSLKLWDLAASDQSNQCRLSFTGHRDFVLSVAFSPNGRWLISGSKDRTIQFWDPRQSSMCLMLQGHKNAVISIAHSPTTKSLATGSGDCRARTWLYYTN